MRTLHFLILIFLLSACAFNPNKSNRSQSSRDIKALSEMFPEIKPVKNQWSKKKANKWFKDLPWLVGCNYNPATAINQIEMWQASTFDPKTIEKELTWASEIGMNTVRVFLHDLVWGDDAEGLYERMDIFLDICKAKGIRPFFVFFDDCHFENPQLGEQPLPIKAFHNSGWKNCPSRNLSFRFAEGKATPEEIARLMGYVQETMRRFKNDKRILCWELYNEPGRGSLEKGARDANRRNKSSKLIQASWEWAREINPSQPITSTTEGALGDKNIYINRINCDIHSIHNYQKPEDMANMIRAYKMDGRPILVTEWLARTRNSRVENILPLLKKNNVGAINWGFVSGKTGTIWPWTSKKDSTGVQFNMHEKRKAGEIIHEGEAFPEPELWFHDLFRTDGSAFDDKEIEIFKELTKDNKKMTFN